MRIKGLHDIKTHGSLAREGRLVSVAKNLHRARSRELDDWNIERHIYKKKGEGQTRIFSLAVVPLHREPCLEREIRLYQIAMISDLLGELGGALAEGFSVAGYELNRLKTRLAKLQAE